MFVFFFNDCFVYVLIKQKRYRLGGRGGAGDFVGGIDNDALDFSQLEAFINSSDGGQGGNGYFGESLTATATQPQHVPPSSGGGKLLNVIVENKRVPGWELNTKTKN